MTAFESDSGYVLSAIQTLVNSNQDDVREEMSSIGINLTDIMDKYGDVLQNITDATFSIANLASQIASGAVSGEAIAGDIDALTFDEEGGSG